MTVSYTGAVPNGSTFGCFWKVLGIWRGSVYKLVWRELLAYLLLYYTINFLYRFGLNDDQRRVFEQIRIYFGHQSETIPMSFVLGFYVTLVVNRWWDQYKLLPWPDTLALFLNAGIPGADETQRLMRRNIVRYAILAYVITLQRVSLRVKKRFPTWQHFMDCGLMLESEKKIFELMDNKTPMSKYWMPLVWATNIINRARKDSFITSDHIVQTLLTELSDIRRRLGALIGYDTVNVPLVYTQVVTLALYTYFVAALIGRQFVPYAPESALGKYESPDMIFPFFTSLQFCFYVGWLKVAEVLINPFGEDDDDIELNWLIDRHIKAGYMIVDEMHEEHPELLKDQFWEEVVPKELPYTVASEHYRKEEPKGSADNYKIKHQDAMYANLVMPMKKGSMNDDVYADYESVDTPIVERRKGSISWFQRQLSRTGMGSVRSASTAYSSGGLFGRPRGNSIDIHAENGQVPGSNHKMTIYDRLVGRRSGRNQRHRACSKSGQVPIKSRPRIPTPDVTKEIIEKEIRFPTVNVHATGVPIKDGGPILQMFLSPIQETDGSGSVNSTLHATQPGAAALASAILSHGVRPVLMSSPMLDREFSQPTQTPILTTLFEKPALLKTEREQILPLQELFPVEAENEIVIANSEIASESSSSSNASKESKHTDATASLKNFDVSKETPENTLNPSSSAPSSLTALVPEDKTRKTSIISQGGIQPSSPKRGEVYV